MTFAVYVGGALAFSAAAVLALGAALEFERHWRRLMLPALYLVILLYVCISPLLWDRDLRSQAELVEAGFATKWVTRLFILTALAMCIVRVMGAAFSRENRGAGGAALGVALAVYFLTSVVLSSTLGTNPEFRLSLYYAPFLFAAVYATRSQDPEIALRFAKVGLLALLAASCLVALVAPDMAIERHYDSWIPGVTVRFWGLAGHANVMGALALVYLLLAVHQPFERHWLQHIGLSLGVAVLLAAQSKTTWIAAALGIPLMLVARSGDWGKVGISLVALGALASSAMLVLPVFGVTIESLADTHQGYEASRLSGRVTLWTIAIEEWARNPLFGYGTTLWDSTHRVQFGTDAPFAHNQLLQDMSTAGTTGLIGLLVYSGALSLYAIRGCRSSRGLSVALLVLVLVRCMTEIPLSIDSFLGRRGVDFAHLLLFQLALAYGSNAERRS